MMNKHAYLRLPKRIVKKSKVGDLLNIYDKVEIIKSINNLNNPSMLKIIPYVYISFNDLQTLLGACKKYNDLKIPICTGVQSTRDVINYKTLLKLIEIENDRNINLSISKSMKETLKTFIS